MTNQPAAQAPQIIDKTVDKAFDKAWVTFPGGELEGRRPKLMCPACRERANRQSTLCFQCYRADLDRERALKAAGEFDTASEARFQCALPLDPVNQPRLERLRAERAASRVAFQSGTGRFVDKQRRAQIAARHAIQSIGVHPDSSLHAAELQLPEAWLPFVMSGA